jgi:hypothetical protein
MSNVFKVLCPEALIWRALPSISPLVTTRQRTSGIYPFFTGFWNPNGTKKPYKNIARIRGKNKSYLFSIWKISDASDGIALSDTSDRAF